MVRGQSAKPEERSDRGPRATLVLLIFSRWHNLSQSWVTIPAQEAAGTFQARKGLTSILTNVCIIKIIRRIMIIQFNNQGCSNARRDSRQECRDGNFDKKQIACRPTSSQFTSICINLSALSIQGCNPHRLKQFIYIELSRTSLGLSELTPLFNPCWYPISGACKIQILLNRQSRHHSHRGGIDIACPRGRNRNKGLVHLLSLLYLMMPVITGSNNSSCDTKWQSSRELINGVYQDVLLRLCRFQQIEVVQGTLGTELSCLSISNSLPYIQQISIHDRQTLWRYNYPIPKTEVKIRK